MTERITSIPDDGRPESTVSRSGRAYNTPHLQNFGSLSNTTLNGAGTRVEFFTMKTEVNPPLNGRFCDGYDGNFSIAGSKRYPCA